MKNIGIFISFLLFACTNVFEENLEGKQVILVAPINGDTLSISNLGFLWEELDGADLYTLQLFSLPKNLILDTVISKTNFHVSNLNNGAYSWKVKATNSAYESNWVESGFYYLYDTTESYIAVNLKAPVDSLFDEDSIAFEWQVEGRIKEMILFRSYDNKLLTDTILPKNNLEYKQILTFDKIDTQVQWKIVVIGEDGRLFSSEFRRFQIDLLAPQTPILESPVEGDSISFSFKLNWKRLSNDVAYDSLLILKIREGETPTNDLNKFAILNDLAFKIEDKGANISKTFSDTTSFDLLSDSLFFWTVISYDKSGRSSQVDEIRKFHIK